MLNHLLRGKSPVAFGKLRRIYRKHGDLLRPLDERQRVIDRAGRGAARVPCDQNMLAKRFERAAGGNEYHGPSGDKQQFLREGVPVAVAAADTSWLKTHRSAKRACWGTMIDPTPSRQRHSISSSYCSPYFLQHRLQSLNRLIDRVPYVAGSFG